MSRNPLLRLVAVVVGIGAIGLAAATVDSPVEFGGSGGFGSGDGDGSEFGGQPEVVRPVDPVEFPPVLEYLVYALLVVGTTVVVWYLLTHRRDALRVLALALVMTLLVFVVIAFFPELSPAASDVDAPGGVVGEGGDGIGGDEPGAPSLEPLLVVLAALLAIVVVGLALARGDDSSDAVTELEADESSDGATEAAAVGTAAGRAADRLEGTTDVDNEIYRAWRELTRPLEVDRPDSSTPGEFAAAAVEAGIDRDHVDELTRLFEAVRYGHEEPTPERERKAAAVLRRIEAAYADESNPAADYESDETTETDDGKGGPRR